MEGSHSITVKGNGQLFRVLTTKCHITQGFDPANGILDCAVVEFEAIWDTGATGSVITPQVVEQCGLKPIGMKKVQGVHGAKDSNVYLVNIVLLNQVICPEIEVTEGDLPSGSNVLIGMDIITLGDFSVTNKNESSVFSFRIPSQHHIDYVDEHNKKLISPAMIHGGGGRNRRKTPKTYGKNKRG